MTNEPASPLADVADVVIDIEAGQEQAVAATKTYTAQLAVVALISEAMAGRHDTLGDLPDLAAGALGVEPDVAVVAGRYGSMEHTAVLGRGVNNATAFEWALKLQELTHVVAQPYSTADFLHGPIAVLESGYPVLAIAARGPAADDVATVLSRCREAGASLVVIGNDERSLAVAQDRLRFDPGVDEWLSPIPAIVLGQLFAYHLTLAKGLDPEKPRGLHKVTRTT
jgi:glucosamine--fructose-6-phosphate aminotransferase (isomerizing)